MGAIKVERERAAPRTGRPMKAARKGERYQIGVIVTGATKAIIAREAKTEGRTISRQVEILIERALQYDRTLAAMNKTIEEIRRGNIENEFRHQGHTPVRTPHGVVWFPPNFPFDAWFKKVEEAK
jgi:hypothetical protein